MTRGYTDICIRRHKEIQVLLECGEKNGLITMGRCEDIAFRLNIVQKDFDKEKKGW